MILGQKLWYKAKKLIPGGTMLFSKNPDLFLPKKWPAYYYKAKGCMLWDLEKNKYIINEIILFFYFNIIN